MPRIPASTEPPSFEAVQADVKRFGPLTQRYAEDQARRMGLRRPNGDPLPYNVRRSRGLDHVHADLFHGRTSEDDLVQAVMAFAAGQVSLVDAARNTK